MALSIAHVCIKTADLVKTETFFIEGLGMTKVFDFKKGNRRVGCYLKMSRRHYIEIFEAPEENGRSPIAHLCLETDDIDAMIQRLNRFGVKTTEKKMGCDSTYQTWFKDPNGIDIEVHQYTDKSAQLLGGDVEIDW
jgi:catechol 2,3-dioxygenase-like lactoylglutathione lyase family enzyme